MLAARPRARGLAAARPPGSRGGVLLELVVLCQSRGSLLAGAASRSSSPSRSRASGARLLLALVVVGAATCCRPCPFLLAVFTRGGAGATRLRGAVLAIVVSAALLIAARARVRRACACTLAGRAARVR